MLNLPSRRHGVKFMLLVTVLDDQSGHMDRLNPSTQLALGGRLERR
jgi:hypothetical protein